MLAQTDFGWFAHRMLREGGWGCAVRLEAHFDESGTSGTELTLAGYLFEADRIDRFSDDWNALLAKHGLPFLHMVDLAPGNPPFDKIGRADRTKLQMQFMGLIKRYAINGIVCNIKNIKDNIGSSYLEGVRGAVKLALDWADKVSFEGKIAYFFEAGATGQGLADGHFQQIATDPASSAVHRYAGHAFLPKEGNPGVQAADLLAWQYHNFTKKRAVNDLARLDLRALLRHPHHVSDECGAPPRESKVQGVSESKSRVETVYYLPRGEVGPEDTVIMPSADFVPNSGREPGQILACPDCFRAIGEDISVKGFVIRPDPGRKFAIRCWCGTLCVIPHVMVPYAA